MAMTNLALEAKYPMRTS